MSRVLVAIDLDGTLIGESLVISQIDREAIQSAARSGYAICLASGRLYVASRPFADQLGLTGPIIVLQGAAAYDLASGRRLFCTTLPLDVALPAYDELKGRGFHMQLYFGDRLYLDAMNDRARYYLQLSRVEPLMVPDLRWLITDSPPSDPGPIKILGIAPAEQVNATIPLLAKALGPRANVFKSLPVFCEVTDPKANKGHALRLVAEHLAIEMNRTAAIGDSDNDIPMFRAAARSFVVANGTEAAKRVAGQVVPALGDGVAYALALLRKERARESA